MLNLMLQVETHLVLKNKLYHFLNTDVESENPSHHYIFPQNDSHNDLIHPFLPHYFWNEYATSHVHAMQAATL